MDFDSIQQTIEQATAGTQDTSQFGDIDTLFEDSFTSPQIQGERAGRTREAQVSNANARDAARAEQQAIKDKIKELRDRTDPKNFKKVVNIDDGGFDFFDGSGNPISPFEYAQATGASPLDVLKDSTRGSDIALRDDYDAIIQLNQARELGTLDSFFEEFPDLEPAREELKKMNNDQLMDLLLQQHRQAFKFGEEPRPSSKIIKERSPSSGIEKLFDKLPGDQFPDEEFDSFLGQFPRDFSRIPEE